MSNKRAATPDVAPIIMQAPSLTKAIKLCSRNDFVNPDECKQCKGAFETPLAD